MVAVIKFNCLTGLRPNEAIQSIRLIRNPETVKTYYNEDRQCSEHFAFQQSICVALNLLTYPLLRRNNFAIGQMDGKIPTYTAIRFALTRKGLDCHMAYCRKIYSSWLRQSGGIESEIVDLLSGRVPKSVFARHYFTPAWIIEIK